MCDPVLASASHIHLHLDDNCFVPYKGAQYPGQAAITCGAGAMQLYSPGYSSLVALSNNGDPKSRIHNRYIYATLDFLVGNINKSVATYTALNFSLSQEIYEGGGHCTGFYGPTVISAFWAQQLPMVSALTPINCVVSAWSVWSTCTQLCGTGSTTRTRAVTTAAQNGGLACPTLQETLSCNIQPCPTPVDCVVSAWSTWSACTLSCGSESTTRTRTITTAPQNGGLACPSNLQETQSCNTQPCPINCVVSAWSVWSACSLACGTGSTTRTRTVATVPQNGGTACPALQETQSCNTQPCPINCVVSAWSTWCTLSRPFGIV